MVTDSWIDMASRRTPLKRAASPASSLVVAVRFDALDPLGHRVRSCGAGCGHGMIHRESLEMKQKHSMIHGESSRWIIPGDSYDSYLHHEGWLCFCWRLWLSRRRYMKETGSLGRDRKGIGIWELESWSTQHICVIWVYRQERTSINRTIQNQHVPEFRQQT